jgi:hypothetical protein
MNTQTLFTNNLKAAVEARGLTLVQDSDWANTGTFRMVDAAQMRQHLTVRYDFQSDYCGFTVKNAAEQTLRTFHYVRFADLASTLAQILSYLPQAPAKKSRSKKA